MTTGIKCIWLALALLIAVAAVAGVLWERSHRLPPQIVTLPNGQRYRFAGVSYGTNHVHGPLTVRLVNRLPSSLAAFVQKALRNRLGQVATFKSVQPTLCVWFDLLGTNVLSNSGTPGPPRFSAKLAEGNGEAAGNVSFPGIGNDTWNAVFWQVPRRDAQLQMCLFDSAQSNRDGESGRVRFPNPLVGQFPQWQPEPLPAVKQAGDLEVRLENFTTGVPLTPSIRLTNGYVVRPYRPANRGEEAWTAFDLALKSQHGTNEYWEIQSADLSDATGNHVRATVGYNSDMDDYRKYFKGVLWRV